MEVGDTVCNIYDYPDIGLSKGYVLYFCSDRVCLVLSNHKTMLNTFVRHYADSRIVLTEKYDFVLDKW